jgi:uncharacterized protein
LSNSSHTDEPKPEFMGDEPLSPFLQNVWLGDAGQLRFFLKDGQTPPHLNDIDPVTGMNALHIAVGRDNLELTRLLIEAGIEIIPDKEGRMPSLIAAICRVSDELADYIYDAENRALHAHVKAPQGV